MNRVIYCFPLTSIIVGERANRAASSSKIERGKAALEVLILLSDRFRKSIDWILRGKGN